MDAGRRGNTTRPGYQRHTIDAGIRIHLLEAAQANELGLCAVDSVRADRSEAASELAAANGVEAARIARDRS